MAVVQRRAIVAAEGYDYADAFEVSVNAADTRSAELVIRAALEGTSKWLGPAVLLVHRHVLRFKLASPSAPNHVVGWEILAAEHDSIRLGASGPLMEGVLIARRIPPSTAALETFVTYRRPILARVVWAAVSPIHRAVVPYLLRRVAMSSGVQ